MRLLLVTAVEAEREAVRAHSPHLDVAVVGVGMAAAAANTALALSRDAYDAVVCAGIAGGFEGRAEVADVVIATRSTAADLGADSPAGFISLDELGFGLSAFDCDPVLHAALMGVLDGARTGEVLSVNTVTGTAESATALVARHPQAVAEAMEGYGVACAAATAGVAFGEVRTVSNVVGPRDREAWRIGDALAALTRVGEALSKLGL
jgi:futalosine hydrolase